MGRYIGIPILLLAAILNATVMAELRIEGGAPDLVFLMVLSWALLSQDQDVLLWAVAGGVFQDWLSLVPLGTSALGLLIVAFLANTAIGPVRRTNVVAPLVLAAAGTLIYHLVILGVLWVTGRAVALEQGLVYVTVPTLIFNTLIVLPVFRAVGLVHGWLTPHRVRLE